MPRLPRIVVPDVPHHVTQRGNRQITIFASPGDYALYRDLIAERLRAYAIRCSAYCLMPNHVHLLLTPTGPDASAGLSRAVGEAHRRYTAYVNARARTTGHLFQSRFGSVPMDEAHWLNAVRYLAFNPVRAKLCARPQDWPWSSVRAHLAGTDDALVDVSPVLSAARFADLLEPAPAAPEFDPRVNGRPLGGPAFVAKLEAQLGRRLTPGKPGPRPRAKDREMRNLSP